MTNARATPPPKRDADSVDPGPDGSLDLERDTSNRPLPATERTRMSVSRRRAPTRTPCSGARRRFECGIAGERAERWQLCDAHTSPAATGRAVLRRPSRADFPGFEIPSDPRDFGETSLGQARTAFASVMDAARRTTAIVHGSAGPHPYPGPVLPRAGRHRAECPCRPGSRPEARCGALVPGSDADPGGVRARALRRHPGAGPGSERSCSTRVSAERRPRPHPAATGCGHGPARGTEHPAGDRAALASRMAGSQRGCGPAAGRSVADHDRVGAEMIERDIGRLADESLRLCFRQAELAALMATAVQYACLDLYLEGYRTLATTLSVASDQRARTRRLIRRGVPPAEAARALHLV